MGFKGGKANAYHVLKAERDALRAELEAERFKPTLLRFAHHFGDAMLSKLAATPYNRWPDFAKSTFEWLRVDMPTAAHFYKLMLPKE